MIPLKTPQRLVAGLLAASVLSLPLTAAINEPVRIDTGLVQGVPGDDPSITVFKGIPFAAPPVGDLRWRPPQPPAPWQGVLKADRFSAACIQDHTRSLGPWTEEYMHQGDYSEDCLYLNVWTGAKSAGEKRPVFLWIHGGAFTGGSTAVAVYDGEELARKGIVVVTTNYRVGVLGFLAHPELTAESENKSSGNYGMLDQVAALQWIRKNIAAFGGDPDRVTIGGQSAGASAVHMLMASPLAKGLFIRAIAQSGSRAGNRSRKLADAEQDGVKFATAKGAKSIRELRAMPAEQVHAAVQGAMFRIGPIADGWFLPDDVSAIFAAGKQNDVATMTGWTADEGSSNPNYGKMNAEEFQSQIQRTMGELAGEYLKLYPAATDEQASESQKASAREQSLVSTYIWATERAKTSKTKVYTYYWTHVQPGPNKEQYGAFHSSELPYMFNSLKRANRPWTDQDRRLAGIMSSYWANFIAKGDPNGRGLAKWPAFEPGKPVTMELGGQFGPRPVASPEKLKLIEQVLQKAPRRF
ncbi:MAG: carboxylesterase/lipase family protein [bacterium]